MLVARGPVLKAPRGPLLSVNGDSVIQNKPLTEDKYKK